MQGRGVDLAHQAFDVCPFTLEFGQCLRCAAQKFQEMLVRCEHQKVTVVVTAPQRNGTGSFASANHAVVGDSLGPFGQGDSPPKLQVRSLHHRESPDRKSAHPNFTVHDDVTLTVLTGKGKRRWVDYNRCAWRSVCSKRINTYGFLTRHKLQVYTTKAVFSWY